MAVEEPTFKISEVKADGETSLVSEHDVVLMMTGPRAKHWQIAPTGVSIDMTKLEGGLDSKILIEVVDGPSRWFNFLKYGEVETSIAALLQKPHLDLCDKDGPGNGLLIVENAVIA